MKSLSNTDFDSWIILQAKRESHDATGSGPDHPPKESILT
jgi:hypothetical protein